MLEKVRELLDVQEIDIRILALSQERDALPLELERLNNALKDEEEKKNLLEEENKNLVKDRRQKERNLEEKNETRNKFQAQLYQVKTNKEYAALLQEIENVKKEIEKEEEDTLSLMEKIEDKEKRLAEEERLLSAKRMELEDVIIRNKKRLAEIEEKLNEENKEREKRVFHIPKELLGRYERVRDARGGVGIAAIKSNSCQGCFMGLPPQVISEAKLGQRVITCENCNRLLYLDENP